MASSLPSPSPSPLSTSGSTSSSSFSSSSSSCLPEHVRVIVVTDMNGRERKLLIPATLDLDRPKRPRTTFTTQQLQILEMEFQQNHFITETRRHALALVLRLSETQIKVWFQNRRTKFRSQLQQQSSKLLCNGILAEGERVSNYTIQH